MTGFPDEYRGVATLRLGDRQVTAEVRLSARFEPVEGRYRWAGRIGPDGAAYLVDYGAVRDFGRSDPKTAFTNPADAPLVQIPGTGVIWKISRTRP